MKARDQREAHAVVVTVKAAAQDAVDVVVAVATEAHVKVANVVVATDVVVTVMRKVVTDKAVTVVVVTDAVATVMKKVATDKVATVKVATDQVAATEAATVTVAETVVTAKVVTEPVAATEVATVMVATVKVATEPVVDKDVRVPHLVVVSPVVVAKVATPAASRAHRTKKVSINKYTYLNSKTRI